MTVPVRVASVPALGDLPQHRMERAASRAGAVADHLAAAVHREGLAASAAEGTEVDHPPFCVHENAWNAPPAVEL